MRSSFDGRSSLRSSRSARPQVFIAYRWEDTGQIVHGIREVLKARLPGAHFFVDRGSIARGANVPEHIQHELERSDTMLVLIGDRWLDAANADGTRRLDQPGDPVRTEIEEAFRRGMRLIPVLVYGARRPLPEQLPPEISSLADIQAAKLREDDWTEDLDRLASDLASPPRPPRTAPPPRRRPAAILAIAAVAVALFGVAFGLSSALSPDATQAARPTASLELVKAPAVGLAVPVFAGSPADLQVAPVAPAATGTATGADSSTQTQAGTTGGDPTPTPATDGVRHGNS